MTSQIETPATEMAFTGERFMPEVAGQIAFEHLHRYHYAAQFCAGKRVLDVACGEGYGSRIMALTAQSVVGVDISPEAVAHARGRYGSDTLRFVEASAASLPLEDGSFDVVVSFETIEHHDQHEEMLSEIRRVLRPGGMLVISSPNRQYYSIEPGYSNPYHVKELFREELVALIGKHFANQQVYSQRVVHGSLMVVDGGSSFDSILGSGPETCEWSPGLSRPLYDLVVASDSPLPAKSSSFFELKVHDLDSATFYGVHLPERVQNADLEVLRLRQRNSELDAEIQRQLALQESSQREMELRIHGLEDSHRAEVEHLRLSRDDALSSISVLGSLVDEVRRDRSDDRMAHESRLDALRQAFEQSCEQLNEVSHTQAAGFELFRAQLDEVSNMQASGLGQFRQQLTDVYSSQASGFDQFKGQLIEVQKQLTEAVLREERVLNLERLLAESQEIVLSHIKSAGVLREQLSKHEEQSEAASRQIQNLQLAVVEQRVIGEHREKEVELLKQSRSWRYTGWLRKLSGSARRHL